MCIISGPVLTVNSTKILALPSRSGKRQLTVYRNAVATPDSNAMCLPVPNPTSVKFEKVPKDIFKQCSSSFDYGRMTLSAEGGYSRSRGYLEVQSHGSYDVILVPSMDDIDRIPPTFTTLSPEVVKFLTTSYPSTFGIVLCKLKKGSSDYEPFAYSHDIQENKQLFFPTKHFHVHTVSNTSNTTKRGESAWDSGFGPLLGEDSPSWGFPFNTASLLGKNTPNVVSTHFADDWDHEIYSAQTPAWCHESNKMMKNTNEIKWSDMPSEFNLGSSLSLRCKEMVGHGANIDIEMPIVI